MQNLKSPDELEEEDRAAQAAVSTAYKSTKDALKKPIIYRNCKNWFEEGHPKI